MFLRKFNDENLLPNHMALVNSSLEGSIPRPRALLLRTLNSVFLAGFSKIFFVILFLQDEDTCVSIRIWVVLCDIMKILKGMSGKLSQIS